MSGYTKGYRFSKEPQDGGPATIPSREIQNPTYAATLEVATVRENTKVDLALTGASTINSTDISGTYAMDEVEFVLSADTTPRVVTFGTNFVSAGTVTVATSKNATIIFIFSSAANAWVEKSRFVQS